MIADKDKMISILMSKTTVEPSLLKELMAQGMATAADDIDKASKEREKLRSLEKRKRRIRKRTKRKTIYYQRTWG